MFRFLTAALALAVVVIAGSYLAGKGNTPDQPINDALNAANHGDQSKIRDIFDGIDRQMNGSPAHISAAPATADPAITPDEWGMDDGAGVGPRVAGTACLAAEAHEWASPAGGGEVALWCPPPAFVWVPVR